MSAGICRGGEPTDVSRPCMQRLSDSIRLMANEGGTPVLAQRVGDAERESCVNLLTDHHISGHLSMEDLDLRHRAALCAVTRNDLASLLRDLPLTTEGLGHGEGSASSSAVPSRRSQPMDWLGRALPPSTIVTAAAVMSNYRTDLLDREAAFLAALATGAAGVASHWCASLIKRHRT